MAGVWRRYLWVLEKYPLLTMSATTGVLSGAGDIASQMIIEKKGRNYDPVRSCRFFVFGCICLGPLMRGWYFILDKTFKGSKMAPIKMVMADQMLFAPNILCIFLTGMAVLRGDNFEQIKTMLKRDYSSVLLNNYKLWPAAQLINFYFMPLQHRILFVNFVALGWNTYLAWISEHKHE